MKAVELPAQSADWTASLSASPSRRETLKFVAASPLAYLLGHATARAGALSMVEDVSLTLPSGRTVKAALARPDADVRPAIVLFHEWWGLNDQIRTMAADLAAREGYVALAVDLMNGSVADNPDDARAQMAAVEADAALETSTAWIDWLKAADFTGGGLGTVGWCFGGGWSLAASMARPVDATVIYYGNVARTADELQTLKGPVLGHFARHDDWIGEDMVAGFANAMRQADKDLTVHWYDAEHAFANPTGGRYDREDAALAWTRTLKFFEKNLTTSGD